MANLNKIVTAIGFSTLPTGQVKVRSGTDIKARSKSLDRDVQNTRIAFVEIAQTTFSEALIKLRDELLVDEKFNEYNEAEMLQAINIELGVEKRPSKAKAAKVASTHDMIKVGDVFVSNGDTISTLAEDGTTVEGKISAIVDGVLHIKVDTADGVEILTREAASCDIAEEKYEVVEVA